MSTPATALGNDLLEVFDCEDGRILQLWTNADKYRTHRVSLHDDKGVFERSWTFNDLDSATTFIADF